MKLKIFDGIIIFLFGFSAGFGCYYSLSSEGTSEFIIIVDPNTSPSSEARVGKGLPESASGFFDEHELSIIQKAAERNDCYGDDFLILLAIRKAENGRDKLAFGIMNEKADTFDKQAGWCAATIVKNRGRWELAGRPESFVGYLSKRYCPLNYLVWKRNVEYWIERFKR